MNDNRKLFIADYAVGLLTNQHPKVDVSEFVVLMKVWADEFLVPPQANDFQLARMVRNKLLERTRR